MQAPLKIAARPHIPLRLPAMEHRVTTPNISADHPSAQAPRRAAIGAFQGVRFDVVAWPPADADVDLSFACMFEHEVDGSTMAGGLLHLDNALGGVLATMRTQGLFRARDMESLHIPAPPAAVRARALMVIGMGDPATFTRERMERAGWVAASEAVRLGARSVAFAPNLMDAGLKNTASLRVPSAMLTGVLGGLASAHALVDRGFAQAPSLTHWTFDSGLAYFDGAHAELTHRFAEIVSGQA